jgi:hypothetical protein
LSAQLDLIINSTKELETAITQNPDQIACSVDAILVLRQVLESLLRQLSSV